MDAIRLITRLWIPPCNTPALSLQFFNFFTPYPSRISATVVKVFYPPSLTTFNVYLSILDSHFLQ